MTVKKSAGSAIMIILVILLASSRAASIDNAIADSMQTISFPIATCTLALHRDLFTTFPTKFPVKYSSALDTHVYTSITMDRISFFRNRVASVHLCVQTRRALGITNSAKVGKVR